MWCLWLTTSQLLFTTINSSFQITGKTALFASSFLWRREHSPIKIRWRRILLWITFSFEPHHHPLQTSVSRQGGHPIAVDNSVTTWCYVVTLLLRSSIWKKRVNFQPCLAPGDSSIEGELTRVQRLIDRTAFKERTANKEIEHNAIKLFSQLDDK